MGAGRLGEAKRCGASLLDDWCVQDRESFLGTPDRTNGVGFPALPPVILNPAMVCRCSPTTRPSDLPPVSSLDATSSNIEEGAEPPSRREPQESPDEGEANPYLGSLFWMAFVAHLMLCMVQAVLFRYADFVEVLGGTELHLGRIVGLGMVGSVLMRLTLGRWLDRYGPRLIWVVSLLILAGVCFAHWGVTDYQGLPIYLLRIGFATALAGGFGAWTTLIVNQFPGRRMPELLSILGAAGFVGLMLGAHVGDLLCAVDEIGRRETDRLFLAAGLFALGVIPFAWAATRGVKLPVRRRRVPAMQILVRYQPGWVLLVGVVSGAALALPTIFLRPFAAELDIPQIGLFFTVSAITTFASRVAMRTTHDWLGLPRLILFGLVLMVISQMLFLVVQTSWQLAIPALSFGVSQAILFPMVVAAGVVTFPRRYRGLGSALLLSTFDIGQLFGAPLGGLIVHASKSFGLPGYPAMFLSMATALVVVGAIYAWATYRQEPPEGPRRRKASRHKKPQPKHSDHPAHPQPVRT